MNRSWRCPIVMMKTQTMLFWFDVTGRCVITAMKMMRDVWRKRMFPLLVLRWVVMRMRPRKVFPLIIFVGMGRSAFIVVMWRRNSLMTGPMWSRCAAAPGASSSVAEHGAFHRQSARLAYLRPVPSAALNHRLRRYHRDGGSRSPGTVDIPHRLIRPHQGPAA
jgi:hypothetical protein